MNLQDYLRLAYGIFLDPKGQTLFSGRWFLRHTEAIWAYFFTAIGIPHTYSISGDTKSGFFELGHGPFRLVAWLKKGPAPKRALSGGPHQLRLLDQPRFSGGHLYVGDLAYDQVKDEGILALYRKDTPTPVVDFCQAKISYFGVMSGLHDGGSPGGSLNATMAKRGLDLWLDGEARLTRGFQMPLHPSSVEMDEPYPHFAF